MHSSNFFPRAGSNNFIDNSDVRALSGISSLDEVSQGRRDHAALGAPKRVNLGLRDYGQSSGAGVLSSGTRLGSSVPNQEAIRGQKESHVFSCESPKVATFDSAKDVASSSSGQSNYQVPSVIYIDGVPDLTPNLHFKTTFSGEAIIETVENVYEEFQPTAYEWNRNNFMWRSYSTRSASPFKASCHVFKDTTNAEAGVCFWVEMRLVEGDGQDFFDLFARMQFALAPESMAGAMPGASGGLMRTPDAGFGFGLPSPEDTRVVCCDERKAVMGHVLQLCKCKAPYQRQHALKLMCEVALKDNAECLHTMCDMGCVEACLGEIVSDESSMNTQLAVTALQALTRSPNGADCVLNSKELPMFIDLAVDQPYDRQQIARDSSLVIFNLLHWSADRVTDLLGDSLSTWIESGPSLDDRTLGMHVRTCSELFCGLDAASSPPMPVRMYSGNGGGFT